MKRTLNVFGTIMLLSFILAACNSRSGRTDTRSELSDLSEDMQEVVQTIDEAISANDVSEFKNKTDDAVGTLDKKIDAYLDEMDKAEIRIERNTQNLVIDMKKKNAEVELKLALLGHDEDRGRNQNAFPQPDGSGMQASQRDITSDGSVGTQEGATSAAPADRTAAGEGIASGLERSNTDNNVNIPSDGDRAEMYGSQMMDEIKGDLQDLKSDIDQFIQTSLAYHETN